MNPLIVRAFQTTASDLKALKKAADSATAEHDSLHSEVTKDAKKAAKISGHAPSSDVEKNRRYEDSVGHHMVHHAKSFELKKLGDIAVKHRVAYKRAVRTA